MNGSTSRNYIARIPKSSSTGTVDADWNPNAGAIVRSITVDSTYAYIGGEFTTINGTTARNRIARIPLSSSTGTVDSWDPNANNTVDPIAVDGAAIYMGGSFTGIVNAASYDLFSVATYFTMTNPYITASRTVLTNNGITDQSAITSKVINQGDVVTDTFVDFSTIASENKSAVRHALLSMLQEFNASITAFYMPKANIGLDGSGNTLVYIPYQTIDIATIPTGRSAYINLYATGDSISFTSGGTTKTITKTAGGYLLDSVTYVDGDKITLFSSYPITFGGVYIAGPPSAFDRARIRMIGQGTPRVMFQGGGRIF